MPRRFGPALERQRSKRLEPDRVADELLRERAEEDLAWRRRLLEASGNVDSIARRVEVAALRVADDCFPGVDARPHRESDAALARDLSVENSQALAHLRCRLHRAQGVILVGSGDSEDGHDSIPDELLDHAAVALEH
jgi:hypothetical protein